VALTAALESEFQRLLVSRLLNCTCTAFRYTILLSLGLLCGIFKIIYLSKNEGYIRNICRNDLNLNPDFPGLLKNTRHLRIPVRQLPVCTYCTDAPFNHSFDLLLDNSYLENLSSNCESKSGRTKPFRHGGAEVPNLQNCTI
jgi:hypothetical protein